MNEEKFTLKGHKTKNGRFTIVNPFYLAQKRTGETLTEKPWAYIRCEIISDDAGTDANGFTESICSISGNINTIRYDIEDKLIETELTAEEIANAHTEENIKMILEEQNAKRSEKLQKKAKDIADRTENIKAFQDKKITARSTCAPILDADDIKGSTTKGYRRIKVALPDTDAAGNPNTFRTGHVYINDSQIDIIGLSTSTNPHPVFSFRSPKGGVDDYNISVELGEIKTAKNYFSMTAVVSATRDAGDFNNILEDVKQRCEKYGVA